MAYDRRTKAEQFEIIQDKVKKIVGEIMRRSALADAAVVQAKNSLEALRGYLEKLNRGQ